MRTISSDFSLVRETTVSKPSREIVDVACKKVDNAPHIKREHDSEPLTTNERMDDIKIEDTPSSPKASNVWRISVTYQQKAERVCWYGEEPTLQAIEDTLRQTFNLPPHTTLNLRNNEGDIVAISSKLPTQEQFTLEATDNKQHEGYGSDYYSRSDSSAPSTPESCLSDASPRRTPPLVFADTKSRFDRHLARVEGAEDYSNKRDADDDLANKKKRKRRKANEIDRAYKCTLGPCRKVYGSENALKMHIKLKHPDQQNFHPPYHAISSVSHPPYHVYMQQSQPNNAFNGYPVAQHPMHPAQLSPSRASSALPPLPHQYPAAAAMMPAFFQPTPPERLLLRSQSASSLPVQRPPFPDSFNPPALIREPTSKHNLPSIHSLPTLQPSHLPSLPYSRSAPSVALFNTRGFKDEEVYVPQARAAAW